MCFMCVDDVEWELLDWGSTGWIVRPQNVPDGEHLCVLDVKLAPGKGHDFHTHPHQEEIILVRTGIVEQWIGRERKQLTVGDAAFIPMGTAHRLEHKPRADHSHDERQDGDRCAVDQRLLAGEGQHGDEMHRPQARAQHHRAADVPEPLTV